VSTPSCLACAFHEEWIVPARLSVARAEPADVVGPVLHKPDFFFTFTPSRTLLFHFSALTFNAHAIHLDRQFCREIEGHRDLLVHGPLSLALLLAALESQLGSGEDVRQIDYRNLAPLYAGEPMRVCVRRNGDAGDPDSSWDVWAEGPAGGLAVRGTARTSART